MVTWGPSRQKAVEATGVGEGEAATAVTAGKRLETNITTGLCMECCCCSFKARPWGLSRLEEFEVSPFSYWMLAGPRGKGVLGREGAAGGLRGRQRHRSWALRLPSGSTPGWPPFLPGPKGDGGEP